MKVQWRQAGADRRVRAVRPPLLSLASASCYCSCVWEWSVELRVSGALSLSSPFPAKQSFTNDCWTHSQPLLQAHNVENPLLRPNSLGSGRDRMHAQVFTMDTRGPLIHSEEP